METVISATPISRTYGSISWTTVESQNQRIGYSFPAPRGNQPKMGAISQYSIFLGQIAGESQCFDLFWLKSTIVDTAHDRGGMRWKKIREDIEGFLDRSFYNDDRPDHVAFAFSDYVLSICSLFFFIRISSFFFASRGLTVKTVWQFPLKRIGNRIKNRSQGIQYLRDTVEEFANTYYYAVTYSSQKAFHGSRSICWAGRNNIILYPSTTIQQGVVQITLPRLFSSHVPTYAWWHYSCRPCLRGRLG